MAWTTYSCRNSTGTGWLATSLTPRSSLTSRPDISPIQRCSPNGLAGWSRPETERLLVVHDFQGAPVTTIATLGADSAAPQDLLERYARLAMPVGINLEPGREMAIRAMIEHAPLVQALVRPHYEAGAGWVEVDYWDSEVLRSQIALAPEEAVGTAPRWMFERLRDDTSGETPGLIPVMRHCGAAGTGSTAAAAI